MFCFLSKECLQEYSGRLSSKQVTRYLVVLRDSSDLVLAGLLWTRLLFVSIVEKMATMAPTCVDCGEDVRPRQQSIPCSFCGQEEEDN